MAVNKAEMWTFGTYTTDSTQVSTEQNSSNNITKINPFVLTSESNTAYTTGAKSPLFGNNIVANNENSLSKKQTLILSEKTNPIVKYIKAPLASYYRHVQNWDKAVDPDAANTIGKTWPSYENIQTAIYSNPRLAYLAQQANKDYV